ncbi:mechanosensitive ion channel [Arthrobacter ginkgonis]|uniref:Mechanosensitive ion channel n=1 Tax=Arthrobacter ginkgonis TaxID=1630594 RepID=A0ABP7CM81_9MICC
MLALASTPVPPTPAPSGDPLIPEDSLTPTVNDVVGDLTQAAGTDSLPEPFRPWFAVIIAVIASVLIVTIAFTALGGVLRKHPTLRTDTAKARVPATLVLSFVGSLSALEVTVPDAPWRTLVDFLLLAGLICSIAWLATVLLHLLEAGLLAKYRNDLSNERRIAKVRTQVSLLRHVAIAVVMVLAVAGILLLIPQVRALGAGILASAGLISVVAGLAVQSTLANVFAGLQIAFTDAIRVDDTVLVETQQGRIEEITLTYVVVAMPDGRRMILPSTYFTSTPFENWSRGTAELNGNVLLDLNWNAPVDTIRHRLTQLLEATDLWDGRVGVLNVTDAIAGVLKVTITVSARNSADLADLRNYVREKLVHDLQTKYPEALPAPVAQVAGAKK